ncbi:hypothetical protein THAOC_27068, partial [Thalassiosira oceanica]
MRHLAILCQVVTKLGTRAAGPELYFLRVGGPTFERLCRPAGPRPAPAGRESMTARRRDDGDATEAPRGTQRRDQTAMDPSDLTMQEIPGRPTVARPSETLDEHPSGSAAALLNVGF